MSKQHKGSASSAPTSGTSEAKPSVAATVVKSSPNGQAGAEESIRMCAYRKWEAAGRPGGDGVRFWLDAEKELAKAK